MAIEALKRSASEEDDRVVVKKRALTSSINLPVAANGNEQQAVESGEEDELEVNIGQFESIYAVYRRYGIILHFRSNSARQRYIVV